MSCLNVYVATMAVRVNYGYKNEVAGVQGIFTGGEAVLHDMALHGSFNDDETSIQESWSKVGDTTKPRWMQNANRSIEWSV